MKLRAALIHLPVFIMMLSGCGEGTGGNQLDQKGVTGKLGPFVEQLRQGDFLSPCDKKNLEKMSEIANAIDDHQAEIDAYLADKSKQSGTQTLNTSSGKPFYVQQSSNERTPLSGSWYGYDDGWPSIIEFYSRLKDEFQSSKDKEDSARKPHLQMDPKFFWSNLNSRVRGILMDDQNRIIYGYGYQTMSEDQATIQDLMTEDLKCTYNRTCTLPKLSDPELQWISKNQDCSNELTQLKSAKTHDDALIILKSLYSILQGLNDSINNETVKQLQPFSPYQKITRTEKMLHVPLYTEDFKGMTSALSRYIETVWKSDQLSITIDWQSKSSPDLFTLLFPSAIDGRSYVDLFNKQIMLFDDESPDTIVHEIGHVLGIPDHYFTSWNESKCTYLYQSRPGDIMSDSSGGVTDDEWATLQTLYPETKK